MDEIDKLKDEYKELNPLHRKHDEILKYIDDFCRENDIDWCLGYGSALGAKRHKGPIPWDDDVDIHMTYDGYMKFKKLFKEKGDHERFYLQELRSVDGIPGSIKLRMNGTAVIEDVYKNKDMHQGIYTDIFLLYDAPVSKKEKRKCIFAANYLILKSLADRGYNKRKLFIPIMFLLRLLPKQFGYKWANRKLAKYNGNNSEEFALWELYNGDPKWFMPKDCFFPLKRCEYDGMLLCVPNKIEKYLEICYGDWKKIPKVNKIEWAQHASKWSTTEDFRKFCPNIENFKDESDIY